MLTDSKEKAGFSREPLVVYHFDSIRLHIPFLDEVARRREPVKPAWFLKALWDGILKALRTRILKALRTRLAGISG
jgi:hypothetical protein